MEMGWPKPRTKQATHASSKHLERKEGGKDFGTLEKKNLKKTIKKNKNKNRLHVLAEARACHGCRSVHIQGLRDRNSNRNQNFLWISLNFASSMAHMVAGVKQDICDAGQKETLVQKIET